MARDEKRKPDQPTLGGVIIKVKLGGFDGDDDDEQE